MSSQRTAFETETSVEAGLEVFLEQVCHSVHRKALRPEAGGVQIGSSPKTWAVAPLEDDLQGGLGSSA